MIKQKGAVLVIVLLLSFILTILVIAGVESVLLEQKMSQHFLDKAKAFNLAEGNLKHQEADLVGKESSFICYQGKCNTQKTIKALGPCDQVHYVIQSSAEYRHALVKLEANFIVQPKSLLPGCQSLQVGGRQLNWKRLIE